MKGARKLLLGIVFIVSGSFIGYMGIKNGSDLLGVATIIGAIAGGVLSIVWGNKEEHKAQASVQTAQVGQPAK